jgi:hypothetical protein
VASPSHSSAPVPYPSSTSPLVPLSLQYHRVRSYVLLEMQKGSRMHWPYT